MKRFLKLFSITFLFLFALVSCQQGFTKIEVDGKFSVVLPESRTAGAEGQLTVQVVDINKNKIAVSKDIAIKEDEKEYTVEVKGIPVGITAVVNAIVKDSNGSIIYVGTSDSFTVNVGENECPPITLIVPKSHITLNIDKKHMIYSEALDAYGNPMEIKWIYLVDDLPQLPREDKDKDELLKPTKELKNVTVPIGEHNISVMAEIKYEKGVYERWTSEAQKVNISLDENKDLTFSEFTNEPIPTNCGRITFTSSTATVSNDSPLVLNLSKGQDKKEVTITSFPTTIGWLESGNYNITVKGNKNKEEYITVIPSIMVSDGMESSCEVTAEPNFVFYVDENGSDSNVGTRTSPMASVSKTVENIQNNKQYNFLNTGNLLNFVINVSGTTSEPKEIFISKGYTMTIQGTDGIKATIKADCSKENHAVMSISEANGVSDGVHWQQPTTVYLRNVEITGGKGNSTYGAGIFIERGTLHLEDGVIIRGNTITEVGSETKGNGIVILGDAPPSEQYHTPANIHLSGNAMIEDYIYMKADANSKSPTSGSYRPNMFYVEKGYTGTCHLYLQDNTYYEGDKVGNGVTPDNYGQFIFAADSPYIFNNNGETAKK